MLEDLKLLYFFYILAKSIMAITAADNDENDDRAMIDNYFDENYDGQGQDDDQQPIHSSSPGRKSSSLASADGLPRVVGKNSLLFTVLLALNAALGAGVLSFPYAYKRAGGIPLAIVIQNVSQ
jgi:hypothetical protein